MEQDDLWFYNFIVDGTSLWFVPYWYNALCRYDMQTEKLEIVHWLHKEKAAQGLYINLVKIDECLILMPMQTSCIYVYEMNQNQMHEISLADENSQKIHIFSYGVLNNRVYMFSQQCTSVFIFNVHSREISVTHLDCFNILCGVEPVFLLQNYASQHMVYLIVQNSNYILKFDMQEEKGELVRAGKSEDHYLSVCRGQPDQLFLINQKGKLVVVHENSLKVIEMVSPIEGFYSRELFDENARFIECVEHGRFVYFFAGSMIIKVDKESYKISRAAFSSYLLGEGRKRTKCLSDNIFAVKKSGDYLFAENMYKCTFFRIDLRHCKAVQFNIPINKLDISGIEDLADSYTAEAFEGETLYYNLENMLQHVKKSRNSNSYDEQGVGKQIWADIKKKFYLCSDIQLR